MRHILEATMSFLSQNRGSRVYWGIYSCFLVTADKIKKLETKGRYTCNHVNYWIEFTVLLFSRTSYITVRYIGILKQYRGFYSTVFRASLIDDSVVVSIPMWPMTDVNVIRYTVWIVYEGYCVLALTLYKAVAIYQLPRRGTTARWHRTLFYNYFKPPFRAESYSLPLVERVPLPGCSKCIATFDVYSNGQWQQKLPQGSIFTGLWMTMLDMLVCPSVAVKCELYWCYLAWALLCLIKG